MQPTHTSVDGICCSARKNLWGHIYKNVSSILQLFRKAAAVIFLSDHTPPHRGTTRPSVPSRIEFQIVALEPSVGSVRETRICMFRLIAW